MCLYIIKSRLVLYWFKSLISIVSKHRARSEVASHMHTSGDQIVFSKMRSVIFFSSTHPRRLGRWSRSRSRPVATIEKEKSPYIREPSQVAQGNLRLPHVVSLRKRENCKPHGRHRRLVRFERGKSRCRARIASVCDARRRCEWSPEADGERRWRRPVGRGDFERGWHLGDVLPILELSGATTRPRRNELSRVM